MSPACGQVAAPEPAWVRPGWHQRAACRGVDTGLFFPGRGQMDVLAAAVAVCAGCPVRAECAEAGMAETWGVWGGTSDRERRRIRKQRKAAA